MKKFMALLMLVAMTSTAGAQQFKISSVEEAFPENRFMGIMEFVPERLKGMHLSRIIQKDHTQPTADLGIEAPMILITDTEVTIYFGDDRTAKKITGVRILVNPDFKADTMILVLENQVRVVITLIGDSINIFQVYSYNGIKFSPVVKFTGRRD